MVAVGRPALSGSARRAAYGFRFLDRRLEMRVAAVDVDEILDLAGRRRPGGEIGHVDRDLAGDLLLGMAVLELLSNVVARDAEECCGHAARVLQPHAAM